MLLIVIAKTQNSVHVNYVTSTARRENRICAYAKFIRSDEGLTLETSAFQFLYGGQFTLSTLFIYQIYAKSSQARPLFTTRRQQPQLKRIVHDV